MKITSLGLFNFLIAQWFFVRLGKQYHTEKDEPYCDNAKEIQVFEGYVLLCGVYPLTGWWSDYRHVSKRIIIELGKMEELAETIFWAITSLVVAFLCTVSVLASIWATLFTAGVR